MARRLEVEFVGDTRSLERAFKRADNASDKSKGKFAAVGAVAGRAAKGGILALGAGAALAGPKLISLASDAQETASKFKTVFGKEAANATRVLDEFSKATGTSKFALREQAAGFQALIRPMGLTTKGASDMSLGMTKLATDIASFNNTSVEDAILALKSGLVGEAEPMRKFGVQLSAARVQAFAYANAIAKQGQELTAAQKAQASYGIILEDTKLAQGDATKTAGSFANQFKRLKSQVTDLATELGVKLLPAATAAVGAITGFISGLSSGKGTVSGFGGAITTVTGWLRENRETVRDVGRIAQWTFNNVLAPSFEALRAVAGRVLPGVEKMLSGFASVVKGVVQVIAGILTGDFGKAWDGVKSIFSGAISFILGAVRAATAPFREAASRVGAAIGGALDAAWTAIKSTASTAWNLIKTYITLPMTTAASVVRNTLGLGGLTGWLSGAWNNIRAAANTAWDVVKSHITGPVSTAASVVRNALGQEGLTGWLSAAWNNIRSGATIAWNAFKGNIVEPVREAVSAVKVAIGNAKEGLIGWLGARVDDIKKAADKLAAPFVAAFEKMAGAVKDVLEFLGQVIGKIKDVIELIGKIKIPKINIPGIGGGAGTGDGRVGPAPSVSGTGLNAFNAIAGRFGLSPGSGFRAGDDGWHGQGRARDFPGAPAQMLGFARFLAANYGRKLLELIYTPLGFGIKNGQQVPMSFFGNEVAADHFDHVHVAMAKGGLVTGHTFAELGEKPGARREAVLPLNRQVYGELGRGIADAGGRGGVTINHYGDLVVTDPGDRDVIAGRLAWLAEQAA